jgi:hypothetical protein
MYAELKCENGFAWKTRVNPSRTEQEVKDYFLGNLFETGVYPKEEFSRCIECKVNKE